jgi:hypothetical protein
MEGAMTLSMMTFSMITLSIMALYVTLSINDTQNNNVQQYAKRHYDECRILLIALMSVVVQNAIILSVVAPYGE